MVVFQEEFSVSSSERRELIDVTDKVENLVKKSKIKNGMCLVFVPHATAAVFLNENEPGLVDDILNKIEDLFPENAGYKHDRIDSNADSHLASSFIGQSKTMSVKDGRLLRGTWQQIFILEMDGPRSDRRIFVTIVGE